MRSWCYARLVMVCTVQFGRVVLSATSTQTQPHFNPLLFFGNGNRTSICVRWHTQHRRDLLNLGILILWLQPSQHEEPRLTYMTGKTADAWHWDQTGQMLAYHNLCMVGSKSNPTGSVGYTARAQTDACDRNKELLHDVLPMPNARPHWRGANDVRYEK